MNDKDNIKWTSMSDRALSETIGAFVKQHRLEQNKTQEEVAGAAGISRSTLSLLERGQTVTLSTFIQVLRVLDLLHVMEVFEPQWRISPLQLARLESKQRKRARKKEEGHLDDSEW